MLYCWLVQSPARFPHWWWCCCLLWGSLHVLRAHCELLAVWLDWWCGRRGCIVRCSRRLSGVAFRHGRRPGLASRVRGPRGVRQDGGACRVWTWVWVGGWATGR